MSHNPELYCHCLPIVQKYHSLFLTYTYKAYQKISCLLPFQKFKVSIYFPNFVAKTSFFVLTNFFKISFIVAKSSSLWSSFSIISLWVRNHVHCCFWQGSQWVVGALKICSETGALRFHRNQYQYLFSLRVHLSEK